MEDEFKLQGDVTRPPQHVIDKNRLESEHYFKTGKRIELTEEEVIQLINRVDTSYGIREESS